MALVKWIDPVKTQTGPSARAYFGSAVMPPNLRPVFLHDRGGAGGPQQLLGPKEGVGAPYELEYWTYYFYNNGQLVGTSGPHLRTHAQGYAGITQAFNSWQPGGIPPGATPVWKYKAVCGSYTKTNILMQPVSYCTYDGVKTTIGNYQPPPPNPIPFVYPFPFTSFFRRSIPLSPFGTQPFGGTTVTTTQFQTRITRPPVPFLFGPGEGRLGQNEACDALNAQLQAAKAKLAGIKSYIVDLDAARIAAYQNGDTATGQALDAQYAGQVSARNAAQAQVNQIQQQLNECEAAAGSGGGAPPPPAPECTPATPCTDPTKECVSGSCVDKCPTGYKRAADGSCESTATTAGIGGGSGWGWLLGIGAAIGAIFLGMRAPNLPKQPARAARARSQKRRRSAPKRRRAAA